MNSTTTTISGPTISGGTRVPTRLPEKTGSRDTMSESDAERVEQRQPGQQRPNAARRGTPT